MYLINVQTSVEADVFPKLPAWEDMIAEKNPKGVAKPSLHPEQEY